MKIHEEYMKNKSHYDQFLGESGEKEKEQYVREQKWNSGFVDIVAGIISKVLVARILVITFSVEKVYEGVRQVGETSVNKTILFALFNDHYWRIEAEIGERFRVHGSKSKVNVVLPFVSSRCASEVKKVVARSGVSLNVCLKSKSMYTSCVSLKLVQRKLIKWTKKELCTK